MTLLGITGGVGMGKSAAAGLLVSQGVSVADTDELARRLVGRGSDALAEIALAFGPGMIDAEGSLRRSELARIVFSDSAARLRLERILHPRIAAAWREQVARWRDQGELVAAVIVPLLFEKGYEGEFGTVVCVACSAGTQHRRLLGRGWGEEEIAARTAAQLPVGDKVARSAFVVWTEGSLQAHARQWERLLKRF